MDRLSDWFWMAAGCGISGLLIVAVVYWSIQETISRRPPPAEPPD